MSHCINPKIQSIPLSFSIHLYLLSYTWPRSLTHPFPLCVQLSPWFGPLKVKVCPGEDLGVSCSHLQSPRILPFFGGFSRYSVQGRLPILLRNRPALRTSLPNDTKQLDFLRAHLNPSRLEPMKDEKSGCAPQCLQARFLLGVLS